MTFKTLDFKCALIAGGGGGIGLAIAQYFLTQGKKVIICGRTDTKLQEASQNALQNCPYYTLDTGNIEAIPAFIEKITTEHPELDCLVNNAGVQRPLDVNQMKPEEFLDKADNEISINIRGPMHLAIGLLSHFKQKPGAVIMNVSSVLGFIPFSIINPVSPPFQAHFPPRYNLKLTHTGLQRHKSLAAFLVDESTHTARPGRSWKLPRH